MCSILLVSLSMLFFLFQWHMVRSLKDQEEASLAEYRQYVYVQTPEGSVYQNYRIDHEVLSELVDSPYRKYYNLARSYRAILPDYSYLYSSYGIVGEEAVAYVAATVESKQSHAYDNFRVYRFSEDFESVERIMCPRGDRYELKIEDVLAGDASRLTNQYRFVADLMGDESIDSVYTKANVGETYLFKLRIQGSSGTIAGAEILKLEGLDDYIIPVNELPIDLTGDVFSEMRKAMDRLPQNMHMFQITACIDMSALPNYQKSFYAKEGRLLTVHDYQEQKSVCVISDEFAKAAGISVGDVISVEVGSDRLTSTAYRTLMLADDTRWERWENCDRRTMELEVVGTTAYREVMPSDPFVLHVYVPESLLPEEWIDDTNINIGERDFGIILNSPADKELFLSDNEQMAASYNYTLVLPETGWEVFLSSIQGQRQKHGLFLIISGMLLLGMTIIVTVLSLFRNRYTMSLMMKMGVTKSEIEREYLMTMVVEYAFGIIVGVIAAAIMFHVRNISEIWTVIGGVAMGEWFTAGIASLVGCKGCIALIEKKTQYEKRTH